MESTETNNLPNSTANKFRGATDTISNVGEEAAKKGEQAYSDLKETGKEALEEGTKRLEGLEDCIKNNPVKSVLLAVGAGIFLSRIYKN